MLVGTVQSSSLTLCKWFYSEIFIILENENKASLLYRAHNLSNLAKEKVLMTWFLKSPGLLLLHLLALASPDQPFLPIRNERSFYLSLHFYPVFE